MPAEIRRKFNFPPQILSLQESDYVLSARSCFLIGSGKCKQLSDLSELELRTVSDFCTLQDLTCPLYNFNFFDPTEMWSRTYLVPPQHTTRSLSQ